MKRFRKVFLPIVLCLFLLLGAFVGAFFYRTRNAVKELASLTAPDGVHSLVISQLGDPDWPFGSTHCRYDLYEGKKRLERRDFTILDDGCNAGAENFTVTWEEYGVTIIAHGSEQEDESCHLTWAY